MGQDILLLGIGDVGIYFGGADGTVSQHFLNITNINILFQKQSGEGMAEHMWCEMQVNFGEAGIAIYHKTDRLLGKSMP